MAIAWNMNLEMTFEPMVTFYWICKKITMHICEGYVRYAGSWIFPLESFSQVLQQAQSPDQGSFLDATPDWYTPTIYLISWVQQRHKISLCPCKHIQSSWLGVMNFLRRNVIKIANILATKSRDCNARNNWATNRVLRYLPNLRTFALIVCAHPYCARNSHATSCIKRSRA